MGLLDGLLGGVVGAGVTSLVESAIAQHGGVQGLVDQFERQGLGGVVQSWIGPGANQAISAEQLHQVLGSEAVTKLAQKFGINSDDMLQKLTTALPHAVDAMTPGGTIPR
jgi:uncharacterized protein YidB (DUF937 family)